MACCVGLLCLLCAAASASAHSRYTFTGSFGAAGSSAGQLSLTAKSGVAANSETHDVYVADTQNNRVDEFEADGAFVRAWGWGVNAKESKEELQSCTTATGCQKGLSGSAPGEFEAPSYVAVDNSPSGAGDVYVADTGDSLVSKFDKTGALIESWGVKGQLDEPNATEGPFFEKYSTVPEFSTLPGGVGGLGGVAVNASGNLWVATPGNIKAGGQPHFYEFGQAGSFILGFGADQGSSSEGIAVDSSDNLYGSSGASLFRYTANGSPIGRIFKGETLEGAVTSGADGLAVDPVTNDIYAEVGGSVERFASSCETVGPLSEGCIPLESFGTPQSVGGAGLAVDSGTGTVYALKPGSGTVEVFTSEVPRPPTMESESVSAVTSDSATFSTTIDPNGPKTSYRVEYGLSASYGESIPVPDGLVGSGFESQELGLHVQGLEAQTTYHYRVVSYNEKGTTYGEDSTFTTQLSAAGFGLPDGREWELVTPAEKHGALFLAPNAGNRKEPEIDPLVAEASVNGDAMIDTASAATETQPAGYVQDVSVLSTRGSDGWSSRMLVVPNKRATGSSLNLGGEYEFFSEDLSSGIVDPFINFYRDFTPLSPQATEATPYIHSNYTNSKVNDPCESSCYVPLVTAANTEPGVKFGEDRSVGFAGANCPEICGPVVVDATPDLGFVALAAEVLLTSIPNERKAGGVGPYFYEWGAGRLQPLYLLPEGEGGAGVYAGPLSSVNHQLSEDGSVFFSYKEHLYMHDFARDEAVRLDLANGVSEPGEGGASFLYASSDGSRVLFSDSKPLTSAGEAGIYECRIVQAGGAPPACELSLTGLSQGTLIGGSEDASYLYFENSAGNLIVDHYEAGKWTTTIGPYVGEMPKSASAFFVVGSQTQSVVRVSPDGRWLTFMSEEELTNYDNRDAVSGRPDVEVYLYDADSNKLACASCDPTGARPVGVTYNEGGELVAGSLQENLTSSIWVAANLPPWTRANSYDEDRYQPRFLFDDGRLFFDSRDALAPQDVDGAQDVYEWEPPGTGGCTTASAGFSQRSGGCVGLISSGASAEESAFMDASGNGGDVFFITLAKLTPEDFDGALDVYDAHECTTQSPCAPPVAVAPPACATGDSCKAAPTPQPSIFGAPASATFTGAGDVSPSGVPVVKAAKPKPLSRAQKLARALRVCAKKRRVQRAGCERVARRRYGKVVNRGKRG